MPLQELPPDRRLEGGKLQPPVAVAGNEKPDGGVAEVAGAVKKNDSPA